MKQQNRMVICNSCGVSKIKIRIPRADGKDLWKDERGYTWNGNKCRDCILTVKLLRRRRKGILAREAVTEPRVMMAYQSEKIVKEWFEQKGFDVSQTTSHGPDLICVAGAVRLTIEVKTALAVKIKNKIFWRTGKVTKNRKNDDLVAIVLPSGRIHFEDMKSHLLKCDSSRSRAISDLIKIDLKSKGSSNVISA